MIPFTAGRMSREENGSISHDGSISGIVLLLSLLVMFIEIVLAGSSAEGEKGSSVDILETVSNTWTVLATISCIILCIYYSRNREIVSENKNWDVTSKIKLRFLWAFTFARMTYDILQLAEYIDCLNLSPDSIAKQQIVTYSLRLIFAIVQTGFLTYFCQYVFYSNLVSYYSLLVICMGNISVFVRTFLSTYKHIQNDGNNVTKYINFSNQSSHVSCDEVSSIHAVTVKVNPYIEPAVCENALLSLLFLIEIWPKVGRSSSNTSDITYDCLNCYTEETALIDSTQEETYCTIDGESELSSDEQYEFVSRNVGNTNRTRLTSRASVSMNPSNRSKKLICASLPILLCIPALVMYGIRVGAHGNTNKKLISSFTAYNSFTATITFIFLVKIFYNLQGQCRPTSNFRILNGNDKMLITSFLGTLAYYTVRVISNIFLFRNGNDRYIYIYEYTVYIISAYFQTIFLLQIRNYEKIRPGTSILSIEYTFILLSADNLTSWCIDTFITSQRIFRADASFQFYGQEAWVEYYTFLYPFVVFYRFLCFVSFYGLYDYFHR